MNTFKRKALMSAVLGTLGAAGTAEAVYVNPNGTGQVLYYPYYTVQSAGGNAYNTLLSVTNTTTAVKVIKVRFREGKNSREVLDFNLYLSPNDMWTAGIIPSTTASDSAARIVTADVSCTNPPIPAGGVDFRNFQYTGDGLGGSLERTREGYFEMLEMGVMDPTTSPGSEAVHGQNPFSAPTCVGLTGPSLPNVSAAVTAPTGGLMGTGTLINVNSGRDTMYKAVALDQWRTLPIYQDLGNDIPKVDSAFPAVSTVLANGSVYNSSWSISADLRVQPGARAVSATLMHTDVMNEFILDNASRSNTDWVITFPTRHLFVLGNVTNPVTSTATTPFTNILTTSGACEGFTFTFFNREESTVFANDFSPFQTAQGGALCWESTVLSIRNGATHSPTGSATSLVLGSTNAAAVNIQTSSFQNGWGRLHFDGSNASNVGLVSDITSMTFRNSPFANPVGSATPNGFVGAQTFRGLPVMGFMIRTFENGNLTCGTATCQGNYGGSVEHSYRSVITP
jgi:hypothetical protein